MPESLPKRGPRKSCPSRTGLHGRSFSRTPVPREWCVGQSGALWEPGRPERPLRAATSQSSSLCGRPLLTCLSCLCHHWEHEFYYSRGICFLIFLELKLSLSFKVPPSSVTWDWLECDKSHQLVNAPWEGPTTSGCHFIVTVTFSRYIVGDLLVQVVIVSGEKLSLLLSEESPSQRTVWERKNCARHSPP